jgi:toxin ParE1/3/4
VKHVIRPAAKDDILRQFQYYLLENAPDAATRFLDAVDESIESLCAMPHLGAPKELKNPTLSGLRFWAVKGFEDILIFYIVQPEALRVVRVLHGKRAIKTILERDTGEEAPN